MFVYSIVHRIIKQYKFVFTSNIARKCTRFQSGKKCNTCLFNGCMIMLAIAVSINHMIILTVYSKILVIT